MKEVKLLRENMHLYSNYSWDSNARINDIAEELIKQDINVAAVTDHVEFDREEPEEVITKFRIRNMEIDKINKNYAGKLKLLKGIEVSSPHKYKSQLKAIKVIDFDVIIGSIHSIPRAVTDLEKRNNTYRYYEEIKKMVAAGGFDIVGHLDYINRYYGNGYTDYGQLCEVFAEIKHQDMIIEANTSGVRRCNQACFPSPEKLSLYKEFSTDITIGTGAHEIWELNNNLLNTEYLVNHLGLRPVYYEKRKKKVLNPSTYS